MKRHGSCSSSAAHGASTHSVAQPLKKPYQRLTTGNGNSQDGWKTRGERRKMGVVRDGGGVTREPRDHGWWFALGRSFSHREPAGPGRAVRSAAGAAGGISLSCPPRPGGGGGPPPFVGRRRARSAEPSGKRVHSRVVHSWPEAVRLGVRADSDSIDCSELSRFKESLFRFLSRARSGKADRGRKRHSPRSAVWLAARGARGPPS